MPPGDRDHQAQVRADDPVADLGGLEHQRLRLFEFARADVVEVDTPANLGRFELEVVVPAEEVVLLLGRQERHVVQAAEILGVGIALFRHKTLPGARIRKRQNGFAIA